MPPVTTWSNFLGVGHPANTLPLATPGARQGFSPGNRGDDIVDAVVACAVGVQDHIAPEVACADRALAIADQDNGPAGMHLGQQPLNPPQRRQRRWVPSDTLQRASFQRAASRTRWGGRSVPPRRPVPGNQSTYQRPSLATSKWLRSWGSLSFRYHVGRFRRNIRVKRRRTAEPARLGIHATTVQLGA